MENYMSDSVENVSPQPAQPQPGLTIADLILVAQVVQRGATAGLFKAEELKGIGDFYDRLIKFLFEAGAITKPETKETAGQEPAPQGE